MRISFLALVSGLVMSISAAAAEEQTVASQPASAVPASQKIICHNMTHEGLLIQKPQCRTQYAWDKERERQQEFLTDLQRRSLQTGTK